MLVISYNIRVLFLSKNMDKSPKTTQRDYYLFAIKIIGDFGVAIAAPIVIMVMIGQYLGDIFGYKTVFTILAFLIAALASAKIIHKKAKNYGKEYQNLVDNDK